MFKKSYFSLLFCFLTLFSYIAHAGNSPVGLWKTIDDATGKPSSLVRIVQDNDNYHAYIEKDLQDADASNLSCNKCQGSLKGKPIIGLPIMDGIKANGDVYEGGQILDPETGEIYRCKLKLDASGNKLEVRGFIGVSLIGRTQIWMRQE